MSGRFQDAARSPCQAAELHVRLGLARMCEIRPVLARELVFAGPGK